MDAQATAKTILLVEDDLFIALAEKTTLERSGYRVLTASTGEQAIEVAATYTSIDLVLMDIDLGPGLSGTDAARRILKQRDLPLAFLSSHTDPQIVESTEGITSYGYIVKNTGATVLLASIRMAFRLHAEKAARTESEARTRAFLEGNPDLMLLFDDEARIIDYHATDETILLLPPEQFLNRRMRDVLSAEPATLAEDSIDQVLKGESAHVTVEYTTGNGEDQRHYEGRFARCGPRTVLLISRDITERKADEERIRLMSAMLDAAPGSIMIHDFDGRVLYANQRACDEHGYTREEYLKLNLRDLDSEESAARIAERMELLRTAGSASFEVTHRRADGSFGPFQVYAKRVDWGTVPAIISVSTEIT